MKRVLLLLLLFVCAITWACLMSIDFWQRQSVAAPEGIVAEVTYVDQAEFPDVTLYLDVRDGGGGKVMGLSVGGAIGLIVLGVFIGGLIGVVEVVLRTAWLRFTRGLLEGQTVTLDPRKKEQTLGAADDCGIVIPGDPDVLRHHAAILRQGNAFVVEPRDGPVLLRGQKEYAPVDNHILRHKDRLQVGKTRFTFLSEQKGGAS